MIDLNSVVTHTQSVVARKTGEEYVLIPVSNNIADMDSLYTLNESGAFLWEQIDGEKSVGDLISALMNEYDVDYETALSDVTGFLDNLKKYLVIV
jgi:hypothetical protein